MWLNTAYLLNLIEAGSLCGVAYISNRENYRKSNVFFALIVFKTLLSLCSSLW